MAAHPLGKVRLRSAVARDSGGCPPSGSRTLGAQRYHDRVVVALTSFVESQNPGASVRANPGSAANFEILGEFPDVILCARDEPDVAIHLFEVETFASIHQRSADQWRRYSDLGVGMTLVVPNTVRMLAEKLLGAVGLDQVDVLGYALDANGEIFFA